MRKIIHIDMDAFYASVELRDQPHLAHLPVVVSSHHPRAVICAASYPARQFGLHSAMSMTQARQRCPHVIVIEPNFQKYRDVSTQIHQIFQRHTDKIEPLSLDEAYLDVTENHLNLPSATAVAMQIRAEIWQDTQLTASAGVAPNKFLAKIASDWHKPNGICVIKPHQIQDFIQQLPLKKIPGVGKVTQDKLQQFGLHTLADLQSIEESLFIQHFGKYGKQLFLYAQGIDERPVMSDRQRQQISKETTFDGDFTLQECAAFWQPLIHSVWHSLQSTQLAARGISIKLKLPNFQTLQHSRSFKIALQHESDLTQGVEQLLHDLNIHQDVKFRLIGVGVYQLADLQEEQQLSLWSF